MQKKSGEICRYCNPPYAHTS